MMKIVRTLNWVGFLTVGLIGVLLGIVAAQLIGAADLDAEISGLLGGALGAAITVVGAVWLARYQDQKQVHAFNKLIADSITAIRDEAYILVAFCDADLAANHKQIGEAMGEQVAFIEEAFSLFEAHMKMGDILDYETRLWIFRLERQIQENIRIFKKEAAWLDGKLTRLVVQNAQRDLGIAASAICEACVGAHRELNHKADLPSQVELERRGVPSED